MIRRYSLLVPVFISSLLISSQCLRASVALNNPRCPLCSNSDNTASSEKRRIALVIGNNEYQDPASLKNPCNDAEDMARVLKNFGFDVDLRQNLKLDTIRNAVDTFIERISRSATDPVTLFYYAGHGMQISEENYLIPIDFAAKDEPTAKRVSYSASYLTDRIANASKGLNVIILDACRSNPFRSWLRDPDSARGLAPVYASAGTFIAYATLPNRTADENPKERNGLFTKCLLESLKESPICLNEVFERTRVSVARRSGGKQVPSVTTSVIGRFCFKDPEPSANKETITATATKPPQQDCKGTIPPDTTSFTIEGKYEPSGIMGDIDDVRIKKLEKSCQFKYIVSGKGRHEWDYKYVSGELNPRPAQFGGVMYMNPPNNFGSVCGGFDLSGAHRAIKWKARSLGGDVYVEFIIGGVVWAWDDVAKTKIMPAYPDSLPRISLGTRKLTSQWQTFEFKLSDLPASNFTRVVNGFSWVISWGSNDVSLNTEGTGPERTKTFEIEISEISYER